MKERNQWPTKWEFGNSPGCHSFLITAITAIIAGPGSDAPVDELSFEGYE